MKNKIEAIVKRIENRVVEWRRDIHKHAESAWTEFRTTTIIAKHLTDLGYEVHLGKEILKAEDRMGLPSEKELEMHYERAKQQGAIEQFLPQTKGGFTGVVGILRCGEGPTVGMRFDIDAVDMKETDAENHRPVIEGFASVNDKAMHSCGHDGHASIGMGVAVVLAELKDSLKGTVKLVFQPAEEGVRGAKAMVNAGVVDDVDYMLASHLGSGTPTGNLACGRGNFLATDKFDVFFKGAPAHAGGAPQKGDNALLAAATAVVNLYAIPRNSGGATRINIGRFNAGSGRNVIAPSAHLAVETRGQTTELSQYMYNYAIRVLENAAAMHGCTIEVKAMGGAQSGQSDEKLANRVMKVAQRTDLFSNISALPGKGGGSEDFTYMMSRVQQNGGMATFMGIGADLGGWAHHTADFDFDESALPKAISIFSLMAFDILK
ncbi:amidohydrolase [Clostridium sp. 'deep sea']|uniref:amidohydrolase n=1 Tax=Clostridium sp. 'deep sea' TaxID=2779445 RepID=UPI0018969477|nr:amidohydrolase [Clostridium sp. 'deep sea']QOR35940.1 amidohydrolase [Clostridium sp. 'deep sea']